MKSTLILILGTLKHKRAEALLIGLSIALSVLAFAVSLGLLRGLNKPYEAMVEQAHGAHLLLFYDTRSFRAQMLEDWFSKREEVAEIGPHLPYFLSRRDSLVGEKILKKRLRLTERPLAGAVMDQLQVVSALPGVGSQPKPGEIWITNRLADGQKIKVGAQLRIPSDNGMHPFTVSALVVDPHFSTDALSPTRCWVAPGELAGRFPVADLTGAYLGVRLHEPEHAAALEKALENQWGGDLSILTHNMLEMAHGIFLRILAVGLFLIAMLAQLIALFILSASINSAIRADYRQIGVLKTLGFTPAQVRRLYMCRYLVLTVVFVPVGMAAGIMVTRLIFRQIQAAVGLVNLSLPLGVPALAAGILVAVLVGVLSWWSSRRASAVQPMLAIRLGAPVEKSRRKLARLTPLGGRLPLSLVLGLRNLLLNARRTWLFVTGMVFTVFVLCFAVNVVHSFSTLDEHMAMFGEADTQVTIQLAASRFTIRPEDLVSYLERDPQVTDIISYGSVQGQIPDGRLLRGVAFRGDMDKAGLLNLQGRNPHRVDEIAVGVNTAKRDQLKIGDSMTLLLDGYQGRFTVCGIFQTGVNFGDGFRIKAEAVSELDPTWRPRTIGLNLTDEAGRNPAVFKGELESRFGQSVKVRTLLEDSEELEQQLAGMKMALAGFSMILLLISFVAVFNDTRLSLQEQIRSFGIFKAMGLTPAQMRIALATKATAATALGLLIGLPLSLLVIPLILNGLFSQLGMVTFPFSIHLWGTLLIVPGLLIYAFACAWIPGRRVSGIGVRQLLAQS